MTRALAILLAICGGLAACAAGLVALYIFAMLTSGPYSDALALPKVYKPIENIKISSGEAPLTWDVDERFLLEFDNDVVIKAGTNLRDLPQDWKLKLYTATTHILKGSKKYYVSEEAGTTFMSVSVDDSEQIVQVDVVLTAKKEMWLVDQRSKKRLQLYDVHGQHVVEFLETLPK
ncbi:MAG: hypothetical protein ACO1RA_17465 [Planctomycetaceae bacterium]